ncbi:MULTISPECIES: helix-turn-helix domain-containing protein [Microbacterium]|uniref:IclR family transcriptional regulator n=1 Tax=Microbacterium TaxID=33882 RepID=UPI0013A5A43A|nr:MULTISPECIES: helix-turn-helix domain-containing protein [Microbacterium]
MSGAGLAGDTRLPEKGLGLALEILEQVARDDRGASAADIARAVGAPRATVYRVVNSLVRDEYLVRRPDFSGFLLGTRVLELAAIVGARKRPEHAPLLERLREETGEAVHLFAFHRSGLLVLDEDDRRPLSDREALLADPARSAIGHLWLVAHPDRRLPQAPCWRTDAPADDVRAIHEAYAVRGYTEQVALLSADRGCIAVPIHDDDARPVGAVTLSTSIARLSVAARHVGALRDAARALAPLASLSGW